MGDIIVVDRRGNLVPSNAFRFDEIQGTSGGQIRGDIVVEIDRSASPPYAETAGGSSGDRARRKRYPLSSDGTLIVDRAHNFVEQQDDGTMPALPVTGTASGLLQHTSTRRIFTVLRPVGKGGA
jgi:hypothetical protein